MIRCLCIVHICIGHRNVKHCRWFRTNWTNVAANIAVTKLPPLTYHRQTKKFILCIKRIEFKMLMVWRMINIFIIFSPLSNMQTLLPSNSRTPRGSPTSPWSAKTTISRLPKWPKKWGIVLSKFIAFLIILKFDYLITRCK